jgi:hypothetical protein
MTRGRDVLTLARWVGAPAAASPTQTAFMFDRGEPAARLSNIGVVLESGGLAQARARLAAGARQVLLADAALRDISVIRSAVGEFGAPRVGAWLPVKRMEVCWSLDSQSNGDFKCMVPTNPQARWEILNSDARRTGTEVGAWIEQLTRLGITTVLISVDMQDERDLDLCAGLMERFGARLWFSPLSPFSSPGPDLGAWVEFGQVRQLVLPDSNAANALAGQLMARFASPQAAAEVVA